MKEDECKYLILKVVEQAIKDYLRLEKSVLPNEEKYYQKACQFLFDDEYYIQYGNSEKNLEELLDLVDIDISWLRRKVVKLKDEYVQQDEICLFGKRK